VPEEQVSGAWCQVSGKQRSSPTAWQVWIFQAGARRNGQEVFPLRLKRGRDFQKLKERTANLYENKGTMWKRQQQSQNLYENKGT
jgi:hypothetical protein